MTATRFRRNRSVAEYIQQHRAFRQRFPSMHTHDNSGTPTPHWEAFLRGWEEEKKAHLERCLARKEPIPYVLIQQSGTHDRNFHISDLIIEEVGRKSGTPKEIADRLMDKYTGLNAESVKARVRQVCKAGKISKVNGVYHLVH